MFERFSQEARQIVVGAQEEARALAHGHIGTEHLLLRLLEEPDIGSLFEGTGITADSYRRSLPPGDFEGSGHLPFTKRAKKVLEQGLRIALRHGHNRIAPLHIFIGLIADREAGATRYLATHGGASVIERVSNRDFLDYLAATGTEGRGLVLDPMRYVEHAAKVVSGIRAQGEHPHCPTCRASLTENLRCRIVEATLEGGSRVPTAVYHCGACGRTLNVEGPDADGPGGVPARG